MNYEKIYKIVKIIDDETIVINAGRSDGIICGTKFEIFEVGEEIFDPDNKKIKLGTLDTIKEIVTAVNVFEKMCICRKPYTYNVFSGITNRLNENLVQTENKILKVDTKQVTGGLSNDLTIRIGDKVRIRYQVDQK